MAAPVLISNEGAEPVRKTYTLSPGLGFRPTAVTALFDGTGAGGSFLACLTFKSQDGQIIARSFPGTPLAAGDVAEVTFAPFLDREGGAASVTTGLDGSFADSTLVPGGLAGASILDFNFEQRNGLGLTTPNGQTFTTPDLGDGATYLWIVNSRQIDDSVGPMQMHMEASAISMTSDTYTNNPYGGDSYVGCTLVFETIGTTTSTFYMSHSDTFDITFYNDLTVVYLGQSTP